MSRTKETWVARWTSVGTKTVRDGRVVSLLSNVDERGRRIEIELTPSQARNLADSLLTNADRIDPHGEDAERRFATVMDNITRTNNTTSLADLARRAGELWQSVRR